MTLAGIPQATLDAIDDRGRAALAKMYDLAQERSFYRQEIVFRRCPVCDVPETLTPAGRIVQEHDRARHFSPHDVPIAAPPLRRPARARRGDMTAPFGNYGEHDDD